jgi:glutathionylspermidine synthase
MHLRGNDEEKKRARQTTTMKRIPQTPRPDWPEQLERVGFHFHSLDEFNVPRPVDANTFYYWREDVAYEFSAKEVETLYAAACELNQRCLQAVQHVIDRDLFARMAIPEDFAKLVRASWERDEPTLFGRFDMTLDAHGVPKLYEYNADTPTSLIESAIAQWHWKEAVQPRAGQFNSLHEALIERWKALRRHHGNAQLLHFACMFDSQEDICNVEYLMDTALQAGWSVKLVDMQDIGADDHGHFYDADDVPMRLVFKLYPWEWMATSDYRDPLTRSPARWVEPPWKAVLSNKAIQPILWDLFPGHPNLLEASFHEARFSGRPHAKKPVLSREGESVTLTTPRGVGENPGDYGAEGFIYQAYAPAQPFDGQHATLGVWIVDDVPAGLCVREQAGLIARNTSYFVPHYFFRDKP